MGDGRAKAEGMGVGGLCRALHLPDVREVVADSGDGHGDEEDAHLCTTHNARISQCTECMQT